MAITIEYILRQVPNPYKYKYEWMQKNAGNVETLVLGSSHTFYGIRPEFLDGKAFNLANVSQDFKYDFFLLNYWADRYRHLKTVIIPISFSSCFHRGLDSGIESYRCRYYNIYMDCNFRPLGELEISDIRTAKGKWDKKHLRELDYDRYGWGNKYDLSNKNPQWDDGTEATNAVKRHTAENWDYIEENYTLRLKTAEFCKKRHIQLVLITTPCWRSYYDNLDERQLIKMHELTRNVQNNFNLPYLDYLKDSRFVADDFFDSNHLSNVGAEKFTKILNEDIKKLRK